MYEAPSSLVAERVRKIAELRSLGIDPYPAAAFPMTHKISEIVDREPALAASRSTVTTAGRIVGRRVMGKTTFLDLQEDGTRLQVLVRRDAIDPARRRALQLLDLGDYLGVQGELSHTRTGQLTVMVHELTLLAKATHPIPLSKRRGDRAFDAIDDKSLLYRQRHVDLTVNPESRAIFVKRSQIIRAIRRYLDEEGFLEVETPIVSTAYGGASARPFRTRLHALGEERFLRVSPECDLKQLLCGQFSKIYELGRNFRNEGIDASHNPEFTMVEWYEAYSDYLHQMERFETLVARLCEELHGTTRIHFRGRPLDLTPPWRRLPVLDALSEAISVDLRSLELEALRPIFDGFHPDGAAAMPAPHSWGTAVMELFEALVEPRLWDPVFVMNHPVEVSPLTKRHRVEPGLVERFEPVIAGMEVGNAYTELNDPIEQFERMSCQRLGEESYDLDMDFLRAVAHGMPPAGGTGLGVDRVVMILTGADSIRDVILFPFVSHSGVGNADHVPDGSQRGQESTLHRPHASPAPPDASSDHGKPQRGS